MPLGYESGYSLTDVCRSNRNFLITAGTHRLQRRVEMLSFQIHVTGVLKLLFHEILEGSNGEAVTEPYQYWRTLNGIPLY
jgi:hypothetical protein